MKLSGGDSELMAMPVDTLLMNSWANADFNSSDCRHFLDEDTKLLGDTDDENIDQKPNIDDLDLYLTTTTTSAHLVNNTLAELKPLPPFTGYTGNLSINGISGHHYHTIATAPHNTRILIETNNNSVDTTNQNNVPYYSTDHVVSSSTMDSTIDSIKSESGPLGEYDDIEDDFAAIIGSAMADTTVPGNHGDEGDSRDSWMDLSAWIASNCGTLPTSSKPSLGNPHSNSSSNNNNNSSTNNNNLNNNNNNNNNNVLCSDSLPDFVTNSHFAVTPQPSQVMGFHQQMKQQPQQQQQQQQQQHHHNQQREINASFPHMSLLHSRLTQNGPPKVPDSQEITYNIVSECPSPSSSTPYMAHSPPCHVVSTSDIGFMQVHSSSRPSPELQGSYPHTTTPSKKSRNRTKSKIASSIIYSDGNLGKEKTVHRCNICNRGFLNKSNIKVHLRTHTGEKPFRCDVCGKAFRQKAHLIKHAQIHKRVGRD